MATPPKKDKKPKNQEHQKTKEDSSTETKLSSPRLDGSSQVSHDPVSQEADVPASQELVPEGEKFEHAPNSLPEDESWTVCSVLIQLPLLKKLRRLFSKQIQKGAHPTVSRNRRQESPTFLRAPPSREISGRGRYPYHTLRKPRVIASHWKMMLCACLDCGRILRPCLCILTRIMSHLKFFGKKLGYHSLCHHLKRIFQSHPGVHNQIRRGTLAGSQVQMTSFSFTYPSEQRTSLNRNDCNTSNQEEMDLTLMNESKHLNGPFHCPCSETYSQAKDFYAHLKTHSAVKVTVKADKPSFYLCPYCNRTFDTSAAILARQCPSQ